EMGRLPPPGRADPSSCVPVAPRRGRRVCPDAAPAIGGRPPGGLDRLGLSGRGPAARLCGRSGGRGPPGGLSRHPSRPGNTRPAAVSRRRRGRLPPPSPRRSSPDRVAVLRGAGGVGRPPARGGGVGGGVVRRR